jgi:hypothetical protein
MAYEPNTIRTLTMTYGRLLDKGVGVWYGEAGSDVELAKLILDGASLAELMTYCEEAGYIDQEEDN